MTDSDPIKSWDSKPDSEKKAIGCLELAGIIALIYFWPAGTCSGDKSNSSKSSPSTSSPSKSYIGHYFVNQEVIFAATSPEAFDLLMNATITGDKAVCSQMISSGELVYLRKGQVVNLVKPTAEYYEVRLPGETRTLNVISEHLDEQ
jgi:hypothetical protein